LQADLEAGLARPFALARLADMEKLLPFRPRWPRNICAYGSQLCGSQACGSQVGAIKAETSPTRRHRRPEPVRFFPPELGVNIVDAKTAGQAVRYLGHEPGDNISQTSKSPNPYADPYANRKGRFLLKKPP